MGTRRKLFAFPWRAKTIERVYQRSDITLDLERLIDTSSLDGPPLPRMADLGWASDVYAYFGCKPYWECPSGRAAFRPAVIAPQGADRTDHQPR